MIVDLGRGVDRPAATTGADHRLPARAETVMLRRSATVVAPGPTTP